MSDGTSWYYHQAGSQMGPVTESELRRMLESGELPDSTPVWRGGMEKWVPASSLPRFRALRSTPPPLDPPLQGAPSSLGAQVGQVGAQVGQVGAHVDTHVDNHLAKAILSTLFCCLPLGIVAIVKAAQVHGLVVAGDLERARATADSASNWGNWSIGLGVVATGLYLLMIMIGAIAS